MTNPRPPQRMAALTFDNVASNISGMVLGNTLSTDVLSALAESKHCRQLLERAESYLVHAARQDGASWASIGSVAGITRQAATLRWAHLENEDQAHKRAVQPTGLTLPNDDWA